jgi:hypothetical protein
MDFIQQIQLGLSFGCQDCLAFFYQGMAEK